MKICVSGSAGLIGSWIVEKLLSLGHTVISFDNFIGGYQDSIMIHNNHKCYELDICDTKNIKRMAKLMEGCEIIYHCACTAPEGYSVFSPGFITNSVYSGTVNIATASIIAGVKRFINNSSMSRYGDQKFPFTELMVPKPVDPYALAKVNAEQQLNLLSSLHNFEVIHAVPHNCIGPRQRYNDPFRNVVSIMTNLMLQDREVIIYGDGSQTRCFSMIQDDVEIYMKFLNYDLKDKCEVFNIGPDDEFISILNLANLISEILGIEPKIRYENARPFEVHTAVCSSNKIRDVFGYSPKMDLKSGIESVVNYIKLRGTLPFEYHVDLEIDNKPNIPKTWKNKLF